MKFVENVGEEILPTNSQPLVVCKHPGFFDKKRCEFTYTTNPKSLAYVDPTEGSCYFMGGLNGGKKNEYLALIDELEKRVEIDKSNNVMALWHDESHLNKYAIEHKDKLKVLDPSYGFVKNWNLPFKAKIMILDKNNFGGAHFLRNEPITLKDNLYKLYNLLLAPLKLFVRKINKLCR